MSQTVDVDKIWVNLGRTGRYQIVQLLSCWAALVGCAIHLFSIVFLGHRPSYQCKPADPLNGTSLRGQNVTVHIRYGQCNTITTINDTAVVTSTETNCDNGWNYFDDGGQFTPERSVVSEWDLVCGKEGLTELTQTLVMVGQTFGGIVFTSLADRYGRKKVHVFSHVMMFIVTAATALSQNYSMFATMRILTGAFQQGTELTLSILNLEIFPLEIRFLVEVCNLVFWTSGIAIVTPLAYLFRDESWRYLQICLACMSAWSIVQWWISEESLRWLIANGRTQEAKRILFKACKMNKKDYLTVVQDTGFLEWETSIHLKAGKGKSDVVFPEDNGTECGKTEKAVPDKALDIQTSTKQYTVVDLLKSKRLRISSLIIWFSWISNNLTYNGLMLISTSLAGNRFLNFFLSSVVEYPAAFVEFLMLNRYGRKPTVIAFTGLCGVSLVAATLLTTQAGGNTAMMLGATVLTLVGKFATTGSFSSIFLYTPELYPTNMRNVGIGLASTAGRFGGMVAPFFITLAQKALWAPGLILGCMCALVAILMFWVPETNRYELPQTIEETEQWYKDNRLRLPCFRGKTLECQRRRNVGREVEIIPDTEC